MNITCGKCGKTMTPENSTQRPELFLCDDCVGQGRRQGMVGADPITAGLRAIEAKMKGLPKGWKWELLRDGEGKLHVFVWLRGDWRGTWKTPNGLSLPAALDAAIKHAKEWEAKR